MTDRVKRKRGFAAMTPERRKEIASMGAKASGGSFKYDKERASLAGKKSKRGRKADA